MSDTSLVYNILANDKASGTLARTSASVQAAGAASNAAGLLARAGMVAAEASAAAWAAAVAGQLVPSILLLPGATAAAVGALASWRVSLFGLGDAWKALGVQARSAGGSTVDRAKQLADAQWGVTAAQHGLTDAQRQAVQAQADLNAAYLTASQRIQQLNQDLRRSALDQEAAEQAVKDAQKALLAAQRTGTVEEIQHADLAYRQSLETLEEATARHEQLTTEQQKSAAAGVDGSTEVKQAQLQLAAAQWQVVQAAHQLDDAQRSLIDTQRQTTAQTTAAADAMARLSPNAQQLVLTLKALGPAWTAVRKAAQDAALAGVADDIRTLSGTYLPVLHDRLIDLGGAWNYGFKRVDQLANSTRFVGDVDTELHNTAATLHILGDATVPFLSALLQLGAVGSAFLPEITGWVEKLGVDFETWVSKARASGELEHILRGAVGALHSVWDIGGNVFSILWSIFHAASLGGAGGGLLDTLDRGSEKLAAFFASARGQADIGRVFGDLRNILRAVTDIMPALLSHSKDFTAGLDLAGTAARFLDDHLGLVVKALPYLAAGYLLVRTASAAHNVVEVIKLPLITAQVISNFALASALRAQTAALRENTAGTLMSSGATEANAVAENVATASKERGVIATVAMKVAQIAGTVVTGALTAAQWLLNAAFLATPIGWIVIGIGLLVAGFIYLWNHSSAFRDFWIGLWNTIWNFLKGIGHWFAHDFVDFFTNAWHWIQDKAVEFHDFIVGKFHSLVDFVGSIPGRISSAARGMWDGIKDAFRGAVNWLIGKWNSLQFQIPSVSFMGFSTPSFTLGVPKIPYLAHGGVVPATPGGRLAVVGEGGEDEIVSPESKLSAIIERALSRGSGDRPVNVRITFDGSLGQLAKALIPALRVEVLGQHSGNVQVAMGSG